MTNRVLNLTTGSIDLDKVESVCLGVNDWVEVTLRGEGTVVFNGEQASVLRKHFNLILPGQQVERAPMRERKPKYLSPSKAADELGTHPETMRKALRDGKVPGAVRTPGGHWRIPVAYVAAQKGETISAGVATN